jgi:hypothetical protein
MKIEVLGGLGATTYCPPSSSFNFLVTAKIQEQSKMSFAKIEKEEYMILQFFYDKIIQ